MSQPSPVPTSYVSTPVVSMRGGRGKGEGNGGQERWCGCCWLVIYFPLMVEGCVGKVLRSCSSVLVLSLFFAGGGYVDAHRLVRIGVKGS